MEMTESLAYCADQYADTVARDVSRRLFETYGPIPLREENRICNEYRKRARAKFLRTVAR